MIDTETLTRPAPVETVTPIKPSEAIRLGCLIAPVQAFGQWKVGDAVCAMGAMALGFGRDPREHHRKLPGGDIYWLGNGDLSNGCAVCGDKSSASVVPHLNDDHQWSRERIADWLGEQGL